jgi:hypothetical protein
MIAIIPLTVGWLARLGFQYLPAALGGRSIPGAIRLTSDRMSGRLTLYWNAIYLAIIADIPVASWQLKRNYAKENYLKSLSYTDVGSRPLMTSESLLVAKLRLEEERSNWYFRLGQGLFWLSFPYVSNALMTKVIQPQSTARLARNEKTLSELQKTSPDKAIELEGQLQGQIRRKLDRTSRWLTYDFKALGVEFGEMRPSVLAEAKNKIKSTGTKAQIERSEEAYRRIINESMQVMAPFTESASQFQMLIRTSRFNESEFRTLTQEYNKLISQSGANR